MIRLFAVLLALCGATAAQAEAVCAEDRLDIRGEWGEARFSVEVADDVDERARGLMFREFLPASHGMLFDYKTPADDIRFWMRNTLIPLDMLFLTPEGRVQHLHAMARPLDETPIYGGPGVLAVLEIRGGLAEAIGIGPGDEVRHPAFGSGALWACDAPAQ